MATTHKKPARAPRKPTRSADPAKGGNRAQKPVRGRQTAKTTGPTKPNPFDDIAREVNADQAAKDRAAGRDDLTPALAKSVDQAKAKRSGTSRAATKPATPAKPAQPATPAKPAKPKQPTKVQPNGNGVTFSGRPVTKPEAVAARAKQLGLRVRADADINALATRLRATPDAVVPWLATRNGAPTKATAKAKPMAKAPAKPKGDFLTGSRCNTNGPTGSPTGSTVTPWLFGIRSGTTARSSAP